MCCNLITLEIVLRIWFECASTTLLNVAYAEYKLREAPDGNAFVLFVASTIKPNPA